MTEEELAECVVTWLNAQHWDVYQEVSLGYGERVVDLVATQHTLSWSVEVKTALSLQVLGQLSRVRYMTNFMSIATCEPRFGRGRRSQGRHYAMEIMAREGWGLLEVAGHGEVAVVARPRLFRVRHDVRRYLREEQKTWAKAGNAYSHKYTPYQDTCRQLAVVATKHPGIGLKDAITRLKQHHYRDDKTAIANLRQWLRYGKVRGVRVEKASGHWRIFPEGCCEERK